MVSFLLYNKKEQIKPIFYPNYRNGFSKYVKACLSLNMQFVCRSKLWRFAIFPNY